MEGEKVMSRYEGNSPIKVTTAFQLPLGTIGFITWLVFLIIKLTSNPAWLTWFWVWFPLWLPLAILCAFDCGVNSCCDRLLAYEHSRKS